MMLKHLQPQDVDGFLDLLEQSFPQDERRPRDEQIAVLDDDGYTPLVVHDEQGTVAALITLWVLDEFVFVEHFAVRSDLRGAGLGSRVLAELAQCFPKRICLEVELPETDMARRRIAFYERSGFSLNLYPYEQPAYAPDRESVPLLIMTTDGPIERACFERLRDALYCRVYHI